MELFEIQKFENFWKFLNFSFLKKDDNLAMKIQGWGHFQLATCAIAEWKHCFYYVMHMCGSDKKKFE